MSRIRQKTIATPTTDFPQPDELDLYFKDTNEVCTIDSNGNEVCVTVQAPPVYGSYFEFAENTVPAVTNSESFQAYLTLPYSSIPDTTASSLYKVNLFFVWGHGASNTSFRGQITLNGIQQGEEFRKEPKDQNVNERGWQTAFAYATGADLGTAGFIGFNFATEDSDDQSRLYTARLDITRVK